jgi:hypothetical protein
VLSSLYFTVSQSPDCQIGTLTTAVISQSASNSLQLPAKSAALTSAIACTDWDSTKTKHDTASISTNILVFNITQWQTVTCDDRTFLLFPVELRRPILTAIN